MMRLGHVHAALVGVLMLFMLIGVVSAVNEVHDVDLITSDRVWNLKGCIEFVNTEESAYIILSNGSEIGLDSGDKLRLCLDLVDASDGYLVIDYAGYVDMCCLLVESIYVNGELKASNIEVYGAGNLRADLDSIKSSLTLSIPSEPSGYTRLEVDGEDLINDVTDSYLIIYDIRASTSKWLYLDIAAQVLEGVASGVEYDGNVIGVPELPLALVPPLTVLVLAVSTRLRRGYKRAV